MANPGFARARGVSPRTLFDAFVAGPGCAAGCLGDTLRVTTGPEDAVEVALVRPEDGRAIAETGFWLGERGGE